MTSYRSFQYKSYQFDAQRKELTLTYSYDGKLDFTEIYTFDFDYADYDKRVLDRALQNLFFMAGISYYKCFLAKEIIVESGSIDLNLSNFLSKTYRNGLGEFFYVNNLDPQTEILFPSNSRTLNMLSVVGTGQIVGIGGGKDSLVSIELLRNTTEITTWSLSHRAQLEPLITDIGLPHLYVDRKLDSKLLELNEQGAYNGHVPISAILACVGTVVAVLSGKRDIVVSNEHSANEPTLTYRGMEINHQYSKSLSFELSYQKLLQSQFGDGLRYYSILRPYSELKICEMFAADSFEKYKRTFSSCNKAFTHESSKMFWCGTCPKCAFVFLALTPFIEREQLEKLWGKNLLRDPDLISTYKQLLGIEGDKPLECVGEIKEARSAMQLAFQTYPELSEQYTFEVPEDYDYRSLAAHSIPDDTVSTLPS